MTQRQVAIRIGLDGKAEIQRDLDDVGTSGDAAFGKLGKAIDDATAALERQHGAFDREQDAIKRVQVAQANQAAFNNVLGVGPKNTTSAAQSAQSFETAFAGMEARAAALRAQIDPLGAAQGKLNATLADANLLLSSGMIKESEHAAAVALARKEYAATAAALAALSEGEAFSATRARELGEGLLHLAEGAASGRLSLRQLAMGIGDLSRASGGSGIGGLFSALGGAASNPYVIGGAAIVATLAAVVGGLTRAQSAQNDLTQATAFTGKAVGATRDQLEALAETSAKADLLSVAAARDLEKAYARTGTVGSAQLGGLIDLTARYARVTEDDMDTAKADLVKAFADPAKAGEELLAKLGGLDDKTRDYITTLMAQNDVTRAQQVLLAAITKSLKDATDQTTWYGNAWDWVKRAASGALEAMSHGFASPADTVQLANLQNQLAGALKDNPNGFRDATIASLRAQIAVIEARVNASAQAAAAGAADVRANKLSLLAGPLVRAAIPGLQDENTLLNQKAVMDQLAGNAAAMARLGVSTKDVAAAQDAYSRAINTYLDPAAKAQKLNELEIAALNAKTPAQKAAIAAQRVELELRGKVVTTAEAQRQIDAAGTLARAQAVHAINDQAQAYLRLAEAYLKGEAAGAAAEDGGKKLGETIGKAALDGAKQVAQLDLVTAAQHRVNDVVAVGAMNSADAARAMQLQSALAPLQVAEALAEGRAKKDLAEIIARLTAARANDNAEQTRAKALQLAEQGDRNIALLHQELAIANNNDGLRAREIAGLQAKHQLLTDNISAESDEGRRIVANAVEAARLNQQLDLARASRGELEGLFDTIGGQFKNFITQGQFGWKDFGQVAISVLENIADEMLTLSALNPLKNMLFGTNLPTFDSVGGLLGSLFSSDPAGNIIGDVLSAGAWHGGGNVGTANANRILPARLFRNAPRFHDGVRLSPDEVPAILQVGEKVLNRQQARAHDTGAGAMPAITMTHAPTVVIQGNAGPNEIAAIQDELQAANADFERRAVSAVLEAKRRRVPGM